MFQIAIVLLIIFMIFCLVNHDYERLYVKSSIDNNYYYVRDLNDKKKAADTLSILRSNLIILTNYLHKKYPYRDNVVRLKKRFNPNVIIEADSDTRYTSYSSNKGEKIVMCLRSRDEDTYNKIHNYNILMKVALHELAHVMSKSVSKEKHNAEFYENYYFLINEAIQLGIYDDEQKQQEYCGLMIN